MSDDHGPPRPKAVTGLRRAVYVVLGLLFVGLAVPGAILPVLPTTPFLILASYFFVRSSPRLHDRLLRSRLFGQLLRDWQRHRAVRPRVKYVALAMLVLGRLPWYLVVTLLVLASVGDAVVIRLPVLREPSAVATRPEGQR